MSARISKITVGRLYNLGNYEHVRYDLTVEVPEGDDASAAIVALEHIIAGLSPLKNACIKSEAELDRDQKEIDEMQTMPVVDWERRYGHCKGTAREVIERYQAQLNENREKREKALAIAKRARELFSDLAGAEKWTDAKQDWEDDY